MRKINKLYKVKKQVVDEEGVIRSQSLISRYDSKLKALEAASDLAEQADPIHKVVFLVTFADQIKGEFVEIGRFEAKAAEFEVVEL